MDRRNADARSSDGEFSEFAAAAHGRLRNTAYLLCGDWERAADHVQEGLIRVYVAWPRLVRRGGELAYARKAVVSAFLDASRKRSSTERPAEPDIERPSGEDVAGHVSDRAALMAALAGCRSGNARAWCSGTSRTSTSARRPSCCAAARAR